MPAGGVRSQGSRPEASGLHSQGTKVQGGRSGIGLGLKASESGGRSSQLCVQTSADTEGPAQPMAVETKQPWVCADQ